MKTYREEHGSLPIELPYFQEEKTIGTLASSSKDDPKANATAKSKVAPKAAAEAPEIKVEPSRGKLTPPQGVEPTANAKAEPTKGKLTLPKGE